MWDQAFMKRPWISIFLPMGTIVIRLASSGLDAAPAPIRFDGSLGKPGGDLTGSNILASRGVRKGGNLFHSFLRFNVGKGETITFQTPADTVNILARVTGGTPSKINGTLRTDAPANLYLINPSGVIFGNGASVDVAGSFTATTADYIAFGRGNGIESRFWATTDGATTLVSYPPSKFGFLDSGAVGKIDLDLSDGTGSITNDGRFSTGKFSAVARRINVADSLFLFEGGDLNFRTSGPGEIAVSSTAIARPTPSGKGDITFTNSVFESPGKGVGVHAAGNLRLDRTVIASADGFLPGSPGNIRLTAARDISLSATSIQKPNFGVDPAGGISIKAGGDLSITRKSAVESSARAIGPGADIHIETGGDLSVNDFGLISSSSVGEGVGGTLHLNVAGNASISSFGLIQSSATGRGHGGAIHLKASELRITGESEWSAGKPGRTTGIESLTEGPGSGGDISVRAFNEISIRDTGGIYASTNASGRSGSIRVGAGSLRITGARNFAPDDAAIRPDNFFITGISIKSARNELTGSLGSIDVDVEGSISLKRGGLIDASSFSLNPRASAGDVTVRAGSILADRAGSDYFTGIGSGTVADENSGGTVSGSGGTVLVEASFIKLLNGAQISASSRSGGDAGTILVRTNQLSASGAGRETDFLFTGESGIVAATRGLATGGAGGVKIKALFGSRPASLDLTDGAEISARAEGSGGGGSVEIDFSNGSVTLGSGASISARSGKSGGNAGSVFVKAAGISVLDGASISSTNSSDPSIGGNAGSVDLRPGDLTVNGGRLEVSSMGGDAGSVKIRGGALLDFQNAEAVAEAYQDGGDILIKGARHLLLDHSRVSANAERGDGGNIDLAAEVILNNGSSITASSEFGADGIVSIDPQITLSGAEDQMDPEPLDATDALQPECTNRLATEAGSFIRAGRGSTPRLAGGYLPSIRLHRTVR